VLLSARFVFAKGVHGENEAEIPIRCLSPQAAWLAMKRHKTRAKVSGACRFADGIVHFVAERVPKPLHALGSDSMNRLITALSVMAAAVCLTLAVIRLFVWVKGRVKVGVAFTT
jgi:hypothetical protein